MLGRLFGRPARPPRAAILPPGTRLWAIGDIHGRSDLLAELHTMIRADALANPAARRVIVYLGDYVDRGLDTRGVVDAILGPHDDGFERVCLKGNHEDLMLAFLDDHAAAPNWFYNGGLATLASYGVTPRTETAAMRAAYDVQQSLRAALPPAHLAFYRSLALHHVEGDYLFVHAGVRPGVDLASQDPFDLMWIRDEFLTARGDHGHVVVHGHSINPEAVDAGNRIGIDTGAYFSGVLTCLVLQDGSRALLQTGKGP